MASTPEYLICLDCETPCYTFDTRDTRVIDVFCEVCGNDDVDRFMPEEDYEAMIAAG